MKRLKIVLEKIVEEELKKMLHRKSFKSLKATSKQKRRWLRNVVRSLMGAFAKDEIRDYLYEEIMIYEDRKKRTNE